MKNASINCKLKFPFVAMLISYVWISGCRPAAKIPVLCIMDGEYVVVSGLTKSDSVTQRLGKVED